MPTLNQSYLASNPDKMNLKPAETSAVGTRGFSTEPVYPTYSRFLATPLPLVATYQPDALRQFYRGGIPQQRIFPVKSG